MDFVRMEALEKIFDRVKSQPKLNMTPWQLSDKFSKNIYLNNTFFPRPKSHHADYKSNYPRGENQFPLKEEKATDGKLTSPPYPFLEGREINDSIANGNRKQVGEEKEEMGEKW